MEIREYERLRDHEIRYWWHVGRRALLAAMLRWGVRPDPRRLGLDIGCGTGSNFALLARHGRFFGTEITSELFGEGRPPPDRPVVLARGEALPFSGGTFGICTMFDVLEHVEREEEILREVVRILQPGGVVLLSVPAYMWLWSGHDVSLHHRRRYVRRTLSEVLVRSGFEVLRMTYAMATILPAVAVVRRFGRVFPSRRGPQSSYVRTPEPLNRLLAAVLCLEARWLARADLPCGTSLLALARKRAA